MDKKIFLWESIRTTVFCVLITAAFFLFGADHKTLIMVFTLAVLSATSTFLPQRRPRSFIAIGGSAMVLAIVGGGVLGFYYPLIAKMVGTVLAILVFYLPKRGSTTGAGVITMIIFFAFSSLNFNLNLGLHYLAYGALVVLLLVALSRVLEGTIYPDSTIDLSAESPSSHKAALVVMLSFILGWIAYYLLLHYTPVRHLYWIPITILAVIQGSQASTIKRTLLRTGINITGALLIVGMFAMGMPFGIAWLEPALLVLFLFLIFALGFSYVARTFFTELFILSIIYILGEYHTMLAYDRAVLTIVGGVLVIVSSLSVVGFFKYLNNNKKVCV